MNPIQFESPDCHEIIDGDESLFGQRIKCPKCQVMILVPPAPASTEPQTARLIQDSATAVPIVPDAASRETDIFKMTPVARAFPGSILLGLVFIALAIGLALRAQDFAAPQWVALIPLAFGVFLLLLVYVRVKSCSYRLTTQRLLVRRGWFARHLNELELYRVKDVLVDQGFLQRMLGYGTITVLADDDSTPAVALARISRPITVKEMIRTQYRAARRREGVRSTEFLQSP